MKNFLIALPVLVLGCSATEPEVMPYNPVVIPNQKMLVINRHVQIGMECRGDYVAVGVKSIQPARIICAQIDFE